MTMSVLPIRAFASRPSATPEQQLAAYKGAKRVLLVFSPKGDDSQFKEQQTRWATEQAAFADYELVVLPVFTADERVAPLAKRFGIAPGAFAVVLVGKDGNEAYKAAKPIDAKELYRRIDVMPMRRAEVLERSR